MLHDLLLALSGYSGDVFVIKDDGSYEVVNDLGFFHPCEVYNVNELLSIGYNFKRISNFCNAYDTVQIGKNSKCRGGQYLSSLCGALRDSIKVYNNSIVKMERQLLDDPELPLSQFLNVLRPLSPLLAALANLVDEIEEKEVHGCKILEILHRHSALSVSFIKEAFIRIEQKVHSVLYDQLTHWMLYGILLDCHNELFIQVVSTKVEEPPNNSETTTSNTINLLEFEAPKANEEYSVCLDMLPSHIPLHIAEMILFIGEAILVFEREGKEDTGIDFTSVSSHIGLVVKNKEKEFLQLLRGLADAPFSIIDFSQVVETIRHCVSQELCKLVMDANLITELGDLKAMYFLGRGELFQTLIPALTPFMKTASSSKSNFNALFQLAGRQVLLDDDLMEKFTLVRKPSSTATAVLPSDSHNKGWNNLKIEYNAKWPLHKLFTLKVQDRYNSIFTFLLDVRRAQYRLQQLWIIQMKTKSHSKLDSLPWTLRHQMSLLIDNIQYYLQVDVLESHHWQLIAEIGKTKDYQHLATVHHNSLVSVASQCFLNNKLINRGMHILLNLVHEFCLLMEEKYGVSGKGVAGKDAKDIDEKIETIGRFFERDAYNFFFCLSKLSLHQRSLYTSQLIMRIDYNKFYSGNAKRFRSPFDAERAE